MHLRWYSGVFIGVFRLLMYFLGTFSLFPSRPETFLKRDQVVETGISDHNMVTARFEVADHRAKSSYDRSQYGYWTMRNTKWK